MCGGYRPDTAASDRANAEKLKTCGVWIEDGDVRVDRTQIADLARYIPQAFDRDAHVGL
ncbi:MAG: hypothetical protein AAGA32_07045 [Pseudomonadota bacterium]